MPPFAAAAAGKGASELPKRLTFVPFDPATKMSEATAVDPSGGKLRDRERGLCRGRRSRRSFARGCRGSRRT